jgi:hypothetical protein
LAAERGGSGTGAASGFQKKDFGPAFIGMIEAKFGTLPASRYVERG